MPQDQWADPETMAATDATEHRASAGTPGHRVFKDPPAHPVPRVSEAPPGTPEPQEKWVHKESRV